MMERSLLDHFKLKRNPFGEPRGLGEVFSFTQHSRAVRAIEEAAAWQELLFVLAPVGCGKSVLLTRAELALAAREGFAVCKVESNLAEGRLKAADILAELAREFCGERPAWSWTARNRQVRERLVELRQGNVNPVLIIDEAHCLHRQTLGFLKRLADAEKRRLNFGKLLAVVLVGQPQLRARVEALPEIARRAEVCEVKPSAMRRQYPKFLEHLIGLAGRKAEDLFDAEAVKLLGRHSPTPLEIKNNARRALAVAFECGARRVTETVARNTLRLTERDDAAPLRATA